MLTTRQDVIDAEELARDLREKIASRAPSTEGVAYRTFVLQLLRMWDHMKSDGSISMRELHQGLVLLGLEPSAGAVQELYDEIDETAAYMVTAEKLLEFIISRDPQQAFRRRHNEFVADDEST